MVDAAEYVGGGYLKLAALKAGGGSLQTTIIGIEVNNKYEKLDLYLEDGSILSCNVTNTRTLIRAYGRETDAWVNKEIELYIGSVDFEDKPKEVILIKPISPPIEAEARVKPPEKPKKGGTRGDLDDEIPSEGDES
jgi:hypothetical protein